MRHEVRAGHIVLFALAAMFVVAGIVFFYSGDGKADSPEISGIPVRAYFIADAHVGHSDKGARMSLFASLCNARQPDIVVDLGDTVQGRITRFYEYPTDREAALSQQKDWHRAWESIEVGIKEVALGNRDIDEKYPLTENDWISFLGYDERPYRGGTRLQSSVLVSSEDTEVLFFILATYSENFDKKGTLEWIKREVSLFEGDFIVFCNHDEALYSDIRDIFVGSGHRSTWMFIHGHHHGPATLVRDPWGTETESSGFWGSIMGLLGISEGEPDFPKYLVTPLKRDGVAVKVKFYPGGIYEKFELNVYSGQKYQPTIHYRIL